MTRIVPRRLLVLVSVVLVLLFSATCVVWRLWYDGFRTRQESVQATIEAEALLTETYGAEVSGTIENFETQWYSFQAYTDWWVQSQVATGLYLECFNHTRGSIGERPVLYTTSASVSSVRVVEYNGGRFKAIADVARELAEATPEGEFLRSRGSLRTCGVYVFVREGTIWKLEGFFNVGPPSKDVAYAWDYTPDWLKDIIGELPDEPDPCDWFDK